MKKSNFILSLMATVRLSSLLVVMMVMCPALLGSGAGTAQAQKVYLWVGNNSESADGGTKREISNGVPESITLGAGEYMYCIYRNTDPESYHSASVERSTSSNIGLYSVNGSGYARTIDADVAGEYTFTVTWDSNYSNLKVSVTYPEQSSGSGDSGSGDSGSGGGGGSSNPVLTVGTPTPVSLDYEADITYSFTPDITGTYSFSWGNYEMDYGLYQNGTLLCYSYGKGFTRQLTAGTTYELYIDNEYYDDGVSTNVAVKLDAADLTISAAKYATYYNSKYAYTMPSDCKGYIWNNGLVETYAAGSVVPADEPLVIYSETAGTKTLTSTTASNAKSANNALLGTDTQTALTADANSYFYGLSLNQAGEASSVGFYWMNNTGAAFTNGAHKAYLKLAKDSGAKAGYAFNDDVDAINAVTTTLDVNAPIYNIAGQRVSAETKGILIQNGKKFINK